MLQCAPMFVLPPGIRANANVLDQSALRPHAFVIDRNREPFHALGGFDSIAVSPASRVILHVVVEDKTIRFANLVKISAPGNIRRLKDDAVHKPLISGAFSGSIRSVVSGAI